MDRHEYIEFLLSLNLKGVSKDIASESAYIELSEMGIKEAFESLTLEEKYFVAAFIKLYPHIFYVELLRRVYNVEIWKKQILYSGDVKRINWEYHKHYFHQWVGPFFYINNKIYELKADITEGKFDDAFINHPESHFDFFYQYLYHLGDDYGEFPRGRVIYNNQINEFYIYIDKSLVNKKEIINRVRTLYNLTSDNVVVKCDEHYKHDDL